MSSIPSHALEALLQARIGALPLSSPWIEIDQARIDAFAAATGDRQWIHVDVERARRELPGGKTIAHGFLTLSLTAGLLSNVIATTSPSTSLNYGLNKVRFPMSVASGSRVRLLASMSGYQAKDRGYLCAWQLTMEIDGSSKPACVAEALVLVVAS